MANNEDIIKRVQGIWRNGWWDGYHAGATEMIDFACNWVFERLGLSVSYHEDDIIEEISCEDFTNRLREEMKKEHIKDMTIGL